MLSKALSQPSTTANLSARPARNRASLMLLYKVELRPIANQKANTKPKLYRSSVRIKRAIWLTRFLRKRP